jgi:hypothetical protein
MDPRVAPGLESNLRGRRDEDEDEFEGLDDFEEDEEFDDDELDEEELEEESLDEEDELDYDDFDEEYDDDGEPRRGGGGRPRREWE